MFTLLRPTMRKGLVAAGLIGFTATGHSITVHARDQPGNAVNDENSVCELDLQVNGRGVGTVVVELYDDTVPKTAKNFRVLCSGQYGQWVEKSPENAQSSWFSKTPAAAMTYRMSTVHRIIPNFMMQAGDFTHSNGTGGKCIYPKGKFNDESFAGKAGKHMTGSLSMANAGPNTNGSQFFITFSQTEWLDGRHVVFGQVLDGFDTLRQIERCGTRSGTPKADVMITDCRVKRGPTGSLAHLAADE